jgi:hypothetical protein
VVNLTTNTSPPHTFHFGIATSSANECRENIALALEASPTP